MSDPRNLRFYVMGKTVPPEAKRSFTRDGGFSGTDINTIWRIKTLTEMFGPVGIGWYLDIVKLESQEYANGEVKVYCDANLYIRDPDTKEWSKPIFGTGGNDAYAKRKDGVKLDANGKPVMKNGREQYNYIRVVNDECYKSAVTDAFGNACVKLGIGADVYWENDHTKYSMDEDGTISTISAEEVARAQASRKAMLDEITSWISAGSAEVMGIVGRYRTEKGKILDELPDDDLAACFDECKAAKGASA